MIEEWLPVVGLEGWYEISSLGRVRRSSAYGRAKVGRILKLSSTKKRRLVVIMSAGGRLFPKDVSRMVAAAFLGPCPDGLEVNHIDGDCTNNEATNLEYCTHTENIRHAFRMGLYKNRPVGSRHYRAKLTDDQVQIIRTSQESARSLARTFGMDHKTILQIRRGESWKHLLPS